MIRLAPLQNPAATSSRQRGFVYLILSLYNFKIMATAAINRKIKFIARDQQQFFATLKSRVETYFREQNRSMYANAPMVVKTIVLLLVYFVPFVVLLLAPVPFALALSLWLLMGIGVAGIGMSVMHDANHGAYSPNQRVNQWIGYSLNLLGASIHNWKLQHNLLHHTYTNIAHLDDDIADKGGLRFSPHTALKSHNRFQWLYAVAVYGITTLYWVTVKDFVQFARYLGNGVNLRTKAQNRVAMIKIIALKLGYFGVVLGLPLLAGWPVLQVLAGFLIMHFTAGVILTVIFQLAHTVEGTSHPLPDEHGVVDNEWAIHQLNTTANFAPRNRWLSWYVGGLNFQVEHHLFPRICHMHYPAIAPIVRQTAAEFNVPYLENATLGKALRAHFAALRRFGRLPSLNDAIG